MQCVYEEKGVSSASSIVKTRKNVQAFSHAPFIQIPMTSIKPEETIQEVSSSWSIEIYSVQTKPTKFSSFAVTRCAGFTTFHFRGLIDIVQPGKEEFMKRGSCSPADSLYNCLPIVKCTSSKYGRLILKGMSFLVDIRYFLKCFGGALTHITHSAAVKNQVRPFSRRDIIRGKLYNREKTSDVG